MPPTPSSEWEIAARELLRRAAALTKTETTISPAVGGPSARAHVDVSEIRAALAALPDSIGYLRTRRAEPFATVSSEADFQDLIYLTLKPFFRDLQYETPTAKGSASYSIGDFHVWSGNLIIEAKFIGGKPDVKRVADEIAEDIWKYSTQTKCRYILFVVYDGNMLISDRPQFVAKASATDGTFKAAGRQIEIDTLIVPT